MFQQRLQVKSRLPKRCHRIPRETVQIRVQSSAAERPSSQEESRLVVQCESLAVFFPQMLCVTTLCRTKLAHEMNKTALWLHVRLHKTYHSTPMCQQRCFPVPRTKLWQNQRAPTTRTVNINEGWSIEDGKGEPASPAESHRKAASSNLEVWSEIRAASIVWRTLDLPTSDPFSLKCRVFWLIAVWKLFETTASIHLHDKYGVKSHHGDRFMSAPFYCLRCERAWVWADKQK